jgi:anaerobic C4-dicarboxylate transporter
MKTFLKILKIILELSVPLLLSNALTRIDNSSYSSISDFTDFISILFFVILFLEWLRRYKKEEKTVYIKEQTSDFNEYLWIVLIIILFFISVLIIFQSIESEINYMEYLRSIRN